MVIDNLPVYPVYVKMVDIVLDGIPAHDDMYICIYNYY